MALPSSFNTDLLASTINNWMLDHGVQDNIFKANALIFLLTRDRGPNSFRAGGNQIVQPLMYAENTSRGSYSGYDLMDVTPREVLTDAAFDWKQVYVTISISGRERLINQGNAAQFSVLEQRIRNAEMSMQAELDTQIYLDGTANDSKDLTGLALAVDSAGTYGGIARGTNSWWSSTETAAGGVLTEAMMQAIYNTVSLGRVGGGPNLGLTTQAIYEGYEDLLSPEKRYNTSDLASAGFESLRYKGADITWDEGCTTQLFYWLNTNFFDWVTHSDRDMVATPAKSPTNQDADIMQLLFMGNLTQSNCRKSGKLTGVTNS
ncbi:hypothetical protein CMI37_06850 [Candidatus Pacearchaeota archaeon]|nr:hypothetical protein [Candidatus Pacearchaeota archaeon]